MSASQFHTALDGARTLAAVDEIVRQLWRAYAAGAIGESEAENVGAAIQGARQRLRPTAAGALRPLAAPRPALFLARKRRCVSPDRVKSRARRRRLAYSGVLPPALAAGFTPGQLAALRIVADAVRAQGSCRLALAEIAARAGICVTTARDAIKLAAADRLLTVQHRRRPGARNLPNVVAIVSREWRAWLGRGRAGGYKMTNPTDKLSDSQIAATNATAASPTKQDGRRRPTNPGEPPSTEASGRRGATFA